MSGRVRAGLAVVGLVLLGFALGVFADHLWLAHRMHASAPELTHEESMIAMLGTLELTTGQREAVDAVFRRYHARVEQHLAGVHPVLLSTIDSARREIETLLNPNQLVAFHDWIHTEQGRLNPAQHSTVQH